MRALDMTIQKDRRLKGREYHEKIQFAGKLRSRDGTDGAGCRRLAQGAEAEASGSDIIVTAQRRSERLEDVPASIAVLNQELLEKAGVQSTTDIGRIAPGVAMTFYGGFLQPAIRGITSTGANIGENSNVAMYIDGVYQPQQVATLIDLPDIEQVEILKGPQGALYGQNATGGAILVRSRSPSYTPTGKLSASYGNYNDKQLRGYVSGPLAEGFAASLAGSFQDRDGFRRHVLTGERDKGLKSYVFRGKVLFEPSDVISVQVTGFYSWRRDSATYASFPIAGNSIAHAADLTGLLGPESGPFFPLPNSPRATSAKQFEADPDVFTRIRTYGGNMLIDWDMGGGTLTSTSGYVENNVTYLADVDAAATRIGEARAEPLTGKYFVQDVNFASKDDGMVTFLVGAFYLKGNETFGANIFEGLVPSLPPAPKASIFLQETYARVAKEILAGYAEVTVQPTERLVLSAGGRYTREKQRTFSNSVLGVPQPTINEYPDDPVTFKKFTPRVTARYEVGPNSNIYASWGRGFKSGVVNPNDFTLDPVKPETIEFVRSGFQGRGCAGFAAQRLGVPLRLQEPAGGALVAAAVHHRECRQGTGERCRIRFPVEPDARTVRLGWRGLARRQICQLPDGIDLPANRHRQPQHSREPDGQPAAAFAQVQRQPDLQL